MERVIGLDHLSAVAGRFYDEHLVKDIRRDIREWRLECNRDLVELLTDCVEACFSATNYDDKVLQRRIRDVVARERATRPVLLRKALALHKALDAVVLPGSGLVRSNEGIRLQARPLQRLARHASAVLLAMSVAVATNSIGACEIVAPPLETDFDADNDGLPDDCEQFVFGTNPNDADTDGDGVFDGEEDLDGDGVTNAIEAQNGCPALPDTDTDGLPDKCEITVFGTDPNKFDSDGDSLSDAKEDSDGDGLSNLDEMKSVNESGCP